MSDNNAAYLESALKALNVDASSKSDVDAWVSRIKSGDKEVTDLKSLNSLLSGKKYLVGNTLSLADLALLASQHDSVSKLSSAEQQSYLNVTRFFSSISKQAAALPHGNASQFSAIEPSAVETVAAEGHEAAKEGGASTPNAAPSGKKEKKPKSEGAAGEGKKNKNAPAAPVIPQPSHIDLRVGKIVDIKRHPDADSLYLEQVDFGEPEGPRTILSGLVNFVPIEKMQDRYVVGVCNLKPVAMRGIKSYGMLLCATHKDGKDGGVEPVIPPEGSVPGERVYVEGYEGIEPEAQLNPKKKIFETIQPNYCTTDSFECAWLGAGPSDAEGADKTHRRIRTAKGVCSAPGYAGATLS